jgi:hypothetical protein
MKRAILVALTIVLICVLLSQVSCAFAQVLQEVNYLKNADATVDGKWTTATEWTDCMTAPGAPSSIMFREGWTYPSDIIEYVLVEFFTDHTNDSGDFFQYRLDVAANGGSAPQADDILINYTGHSQSGLKVYMGTGSGWAPWSGWTGAGIAIKDSITGSQINATAHWIIELTMDRSNPSLDTSGAGYLPGLSVAVYDASNPSQGIVSWPPSATQNAPSTWGSESGQYAAIPESPTILSMALISFVAVAVSIYFFQRKPRAKNLSIGRIN